MRSQLSSSDAETRNDQVAAAGPRQERAAAPPTARSEVLAVETSEGPGRWHLDLPTGQPGLSAGQPAVAGATRPRAVLALGHGAGGGVTAMDLSLLSQRLPAAGVAVARFEQPWRVAGRRVAVRPPRLDIAWLAAIPALVGRPELAAAPLLVGGRSAGARVACRTATETGAVAVLCLAFPLHLPGRPDRSRLAELLTPSVPRLVLQGTRDAFGSAAELSADLAAAGAGPEVVVVPLPGADHSFKTPARAEFRPADLRELVVASTLQLVQALTDAPGRC